MYRYAAAQRRQRAELQALEHELDALNDGGSGGTGTAASQSFGGVSSIGGSGSGGSGGSSARHSARESWHSIHGGDDHAGDGVGDGGGGGGEHYGGGSAGGESASASAHSETPNFFASTKFFACLELEESQELFEAAEEFRVPPNTVIFRQVGIRGAARECWCLCLCAE